MPTINEATVDKARRILNIHKTSQGAVRPHFWLLGPSGSGKTFNIKELCEELIIDFVEINCASLTKEGISGLSLSKALTPLAGLANRPCVVFCDEFDKLLISGNTNDQLAHESTNGVQNEFLKVLEGDTAKAFGDYGKYNEVQVGNCLFVFSGAFNGETEIEVDDLMKMGVKTEFLGRVPLVYNLLKPSLEEMLEKLRNSNLLEDYLSLMPEANRGKAIKTISDQVRKKYDSNVLGMRLLNALIHRYFIDGESKPNGSSPRFAQTLDFASGKVK